MRKVTNSTNLQQQSRKSDPSQTADSPSYTIPFGVLPRSVENLYRAYAFENSDTGYAFAYDTIEEWRVGTDRVMGYVTDHLKSLHDDLPLQLQESEFLEKMSVNWRLRGYGTVCPHSRSELSCLNRQQADALTPEFKKRRIYYESMLRSLGEEGVSRIVSTAPVVLDSGKGSPLWIPGTDPVGGVALHHLTQDIKDIGDLKLLAQQLAGNKPALIQTSYIRIQAARGEQLGWRLGAPDLKLIPVMVTGRPKVRRIAAQPFIINHLWAPYAEVLRTIMALTPLGLHAGKVEPLLQQARSWAHIAAFDLKSYDTTVAYETHVALREHLWSPIIQRIYQMVPSGLKATLTPPDMLQAIDEIIITMPVLTPPPDESSAAAVWPAMGQTRSGENPTSWKGTEIRRAQGLCKSKALGYTDKDVLIYNYGDDTLVFGRDASLRDRWMSKPSFLGMNEEPAADSSFLMRRVPQGYSYLVRMIAASINREMSHEPSNALSAAAAFCTRHFLLRGHPLQHCYFEALRVYGGPHRMQAAIEMAELTASQGLEACLKLALTASYTKQNVNHSDYGDIASSIRQLAETEGLSQADIANIEGVARLITERKKMASHSLSWTDLAMAAHQMSDAVARTALADYRAPRKRGSK